MRQSAAGASELSIRRIQFVCWAPQVWNSDTSDEARRSIQSDLVSDAPEMRLLYTTPGVCVLHMHMPFLAVEFSPMHRDVGGASIHAAAATTTTQVVLHSGRVSRAAQHTSCVAACRVTAPPHPEGLPQGVCGFSVPASMLP